MSKDILDTNFNIMNIDTPAFLLNAPFSLSAGEPNNI
jgi:hypothetical protein